MEKYVLFGITAIVGLQLLTLFGLDEAIGLLKKNTEKEKRCPDADKN